MSPTAKPHEFARETVDLKEMLDDLVEHYGVAHELRYGARRTGDSAGRGGASLTVVERTYCTCAEPTPEVPVPPPCPRCEITSATQSLSDWLLRVRKQASSRLSMTTRAEAKFDAAVGVVGEMPRTAFEAEVQAGRDAVELRKAEAQVVSAEVALASARAHLAAVDKRRLKAEARRRAGVRDAERRRNLHSAGKLCGVKGCSCQRDAAKEAARRREAGEWSPAPATEPATEPTVSRYPRPLEERQRRI